jgi:hypothetical protein
MQLYGNAARQTHNICPAYLPSTSVLYTSSLTTNELPVTDNLEMRGSTGGKQATSGPFQILTMLAKLFKG